MKSHTLAFLSSLALVHLTVSPACAWDYEGHRLINQLALASLPTNFPAFVRVPAASERVAFLAGEPDRWRNVQDVALRHCNGPDHYLDVEQLADYELKPELLPVFRYDFVAQLAIYRNGHPDKFPTPDPVRNADHTRELVGFLPWAIAENYSKLKSGFSYLKAYQEHGGTADELANAEANIVYVMGVMGHYAGDASQPLHTTIHHHGWVGDNPHQYSTSSGIHSWIDGGYFLKTGGTKLAELQPKLRPAQLISLNGHTAKSEEMFQAAMTFLLEQNKQVEPLYQLEKEGKLSGQGVIGLEGKPFLDGQLLKSAQFLGDLWFSAWQQAGPDTFLTTQLTRRQHATEQKKETKRE